MEYVCYMCDERFDKEGTWYKHNPTPLDLCVGCIIRLFVEEDTAYQKKFKEKVMNDENVA